jgi:hypothetical protein
MVFMVLDFEMGFEESCLAGLLLRFDWADIVHLLAQAHFAGKKYGKILSRVENR